MAKFNYTKLNSIAILIIALSAVAVSVWQVNLTRAHNRLTVQPYLDTDIKIDEGAILTIKNKGQGAAQVTYFRLELNGQEFEDWSVLFKAIDENVTVNLGRTFEKDDVIGANEELVLCTLPSGTSGPAKITIIIGYQSIYDEPFEFKTSFSWGG